MSHPLRIDEIEIVDYHGRIGMIFCPGKKCAPDFTGIMGRRHGKNVGGPGCSLN